MLDDVEAGEPGIRLYVGPTFDCGLMLRHVIIQKQIVIIIDFAPSSATSPAMASSSAVLSSSLRGVEFSKPKTLTRSVPSFSVSIPLHRRPHKNGRVFASISVSTPEVRTGPDDLVASILSKVWLGLRLHFGFVDSVAAVEFPRKLQNRKEI